MSGQIMMFPDSVEEFMESYKMVDTEHIYSNGTEYVPIFRMKQWFEHLDNVDVVEVVRCKECKHYSADGWGYGNCYRGSVEYLRMADNNYCSYGERREDAT